MHNQYYTVVHLAVHLPDQQTVYFLASKEAEAVEHVSTYHTHITAWFELSSETVHLLYILKCHFIIYLMLTYKSGVSVKEVVIKSLASFTQYIQMSMKDISDVLL